MFEFLSKIIIRDMCLGRFMTRKTKIIATIGPSSMNVKTLKSFEKNSVSCIRINTAHGDFNQYKQIVDMVRTNTNIPLLLDVKGPEIRIRVKKEYNVSKTKPEWFGFKENGDTPFFSYNFYDEVKIGDVAFFDNGFLKAKVLEKKNNSVKLEFDENYIIKPNKGVNLPNKSLNIPSLSKKDIEAVEFAKEMDFAFIALSFVRNREDVLNLRKRLKDKEIGIVSKIENFEGVDNIDEIIEESDAIMVARGDLGVEVPEIEVPLLQKKIIRKCNQRATPCIVATQMLESMTYSPVPTRAEVSDVANAVLDGADAVMLSGETAGGNYPIPSVEVMGDIATKVEANVINRVDMNAADLLSGEMSKAAYELYRRTSSQYLVAITRSGYSANLISRFRLDKRIIAVTDNKFTYKKLNLTWGVTPAFIEHIPDHALINKTGNYLVESKLAKKSDTVVFFAGIKTLKERVSNLIQIHLLKDLIEFDKVAKK